MKRYRPLGINQYRLAIFFQNLGLMALFLGGCLII